MKKEKEKAVEVIQARNHFSTSAFSSLSDPETCGLFVARVAECAGQTPVNKASNSRSIQKPDLREVFWLAVKPVCERISMFHNSYFKEKDQRYRNQSISCRYSIPL
jgi:hypothetical protein